MRTAFNSYMQRVNGYELQSLIDSVPAYRGATILKDLFTYQVNFLGLAAIAAGVPGRAVQRINIDADADFVVTSIGYNVRQVGAASFTASSRVIPDVLVSLDDSNGRKLQDSGVPISLLAFPDGQFLPLEVPRIFAGKSTMSVQVENNDGVAYDIRMAFRGFKLFVMG